MAARRDPEAGACLVETVRKLRQCRRRLAGLFLLLAGVALAGCSDGEAGSDPRDSETQVPATARASATIGTRTETAVAPSPTSFLRPTSISDPTVTPAPPPVASAAERVAKERGVSLTDVVILTYTQESWSSTALGCPEVGRSYAQIVTSGYEILFAIQGELAVYHVDLTGAALVACEGADRG